jgi:hypothetical protein
MVEVSLVVCECSRYRIGQNFGVPVMFCSFWKLCAKGKGELLMLTLILLVFSFVCFALAAFWNPAPPRINLIAAGLAFWVLSGILGHYPVR